MMSDVQMFEHLAGVFSYPTAQIFEDVDRLYHQDLTWSPEDAQTMKPFYELIRASSMKEIEELFTATFDLNSSCCLEVGWHLYGEDYQRGAFLVNMRQTLAEEHLEESHELPDHLSHCLRLLPRLEPEDAEAFAQSYLQPAITKILKAIDKENPYTPMVEVLQCVLTRRYGTGESSEEDVDARLIELPVLNEPIHYHNTEDLDGIRKTR